MSARAATSPEEEGPPLLGSGAPGPAVALAEPLEEALAVGLAEALVVGLAEALAEPLEEALAPLTVTVAVIVGCMLQWYAYVPVLSNLNE